MEVLISRSFLNFYKLNKFVRYLCHGYTGTMPIELNNNVKREIENYWKNHVNQGNFNTTNPDNKMYVLSMFPYPSGNLHMGHVRVYSISDAMARFYRMNGKNVFHPIGWDAFGLPAENAAIQRKVEPQRWTKDNINAMKDQLNNLGCSFDWDYELSTCNENYYKWTQKLFLMLFEKGMVYQKEALVNWDPVDKTVLADEQVAENGCSWRSGAKVERKLLKQWFVKTTKFAKPLLDGLSDPILNEWRDIINLQRHWIGECDGYAFDLNIIQEDDKIKPIKLWTEFPEYLMDPNAFVSLTKDSYFTRLNSDQSKWKILNPFTNNFMPVIFYDNLNYPEKNDSYIGAPNFNDDDKSIAEMFNLPIVNFNCSMTKLEMRQHVLEQSKNSSFGGYRVSSKLQDWLVSRQRYWGTPIPIVHCDNCGAVPVNEESLPIKLYPKNKIDEDSIRMTCPKCNNSNAKQETDTLDTFFDSSWYYIRYLDPNNGSSIFNENFIKKYMPVDLYIGGKEHAVLHLYYARFMNHFLHSLGLVAHPEPFKRLLVQGMVMAQSFRLKGTGKYLQESEVKIIDAKKNKAVEISTGEQVVVSWEKMSKSKLNGVDPSDIISEYGCDTTRLIILGDVAPTSHRNWTNHTFPGIINWQRRLWLSVEDFYKERSTPVSVGSFNVMDEEFLQADSKMFDSRNYYIKGATFNYRHTHQLSVAISKMQGLTNSIRKAPKTVMKFGKQYERALACQIIMLAPMAPHFASELWAKFITTPNRINTNSKEINWKGGVLEQRWPDVDMDYNLDLTIKINGAENAVIKIPRYRLDKMAFSEAMDIAFNTESVTSYLTDKKIKTTNYIVYPGCEAILQIYVDKICKKTANKLNPKIAQNY